MRRLHHRRFIVPAGAIEGGEVDLACHARQLAVVLRLRAGDEIAVLDGAGREWAAVLMDATPRQARARLLSEVPPVAECEPAITLVQVVPRGPAMDTILEKATELGVSRIVPIEAAHSVRRVDDRRTRWERIVREAVEQCGRRTLPELAAPVTLDTYLQLRSPGVLLVCHADTSAAPALAACRELGRADAVACVVGGEGGLSSDEVNRLAAVGGRMISLGPRLLRADTAAIAVLAILRAGLNSGPAQPDQPSAERSPQWMIR